MPLPTPPTSIFPLYLLPSVPFRRRRRRSSTSTTGTLSSSPNSTTPNTPTTPPTYLTASQSLLRCSRCMAHLCPTSSIISKGFTGRHGRAYLVSPPVPTSGLATPPSDMLRHHEPGNLPNTHTHKPVPRQLVTGAHTVSDISCMLCGAMLGWKYVSAEEEAQKYKVGMFILETKRVIRAVDWDNETVALNEDAVVEAGGVPSSAAAAGCGEKRKDSGVSMGEGNDGDEDVEFDSQDEDECEDLFMGIWTPSLAKKRRRARAWKDE